MANILQSRSMSLKDFRILPGFTDSNCTINKVNLKTKLCIKNDDYLYINTPFMSAAMQAVTGVELSIALALLGGVAVLPSSQSIEEQCLKLNQIKRYKAGFQKDLITFSGEHYIKDVIEAIKSKGYTMFPVTDSGLFHGKLIGIITDKDFDPRYDKKCRIKEKMRTDLQYGVDITCLKEANQCMIKYGRGVLPIVSKEGTLLSFVFKKDMDKHIAHPNSTIDSNKRLCVGAAISTHPQDRDRATELISNKVDFIVLDASDGYTAYQVEILQWLKNNFTIPVIAGNIVTKEAFQLLVENGADAVKIGMGIGSGCITQQVKATGRGQATAIREIAEQRDLFSKTDYYVPLIADGSMISSSDIAIALALGADTVMMGNFFARLTESNSNKITHTSGKTYKEYWMEGTIKAFNNRRYSNSKSTFFEEGISGLVDHIGSIYNILPEYINRLKATLSTTGVNTIQDFHEKVVLEIVSHETIIDSNVHNMILTD